MATPYCPKCESRHFTNQTKTFGGLSEILVYCADCGAAIGWAPRPQS